MKSHANIASHVIVYHGNCLDGAASAWIVAKALNAEREASRTVTYIAYEHFNRQEAENKIRNALKPDGSLYFVDCAPEKTFLDELMIPTVNGAKVKSIYILDHHKTAAEALKDYNFPFFSGVPQLKIEIDAGRPSAAKMIWEKLLPQEKPPAILELIDMMDGAAEGLITPEDFAAAALADAQDISTIKQAFQSLRGLATMTFNDIVKGGLPITADQETRIAKLLETAMVTTLQILPNSSPIEVPITNGAVQYFGRQVSSRLVELGKKMGSGIAFCWYMQKTGAVTMGIRTDGAIDASAVAAHLCRTMGLQGGGHATAAAVHFPSLFKFAQHIVLKNKTDSAKQPANDTKKPDAPNKKRA